MCICTTGPCSIYVLVCISTLYHHLNLLTTIHSILTLYSLTSLYIHTLHIYIYIYAGDIYTTDAILAQLMAAPRSVFSWDIIIQKVNNMIFLDKREGSTFDFLTVSETGMLYII